MTRHHQILACLVGLSLVVKLVAFAAIWHVDPERVVTGDTASYENPARALVAADGANGVVRRALEMPPLRRSVPQHTAIHSQVRPILCSE